MLPEQQQHILGDFIEEAKDHLNTIEQGLLNLQRTLDNPEMMNEVIRAVHSIKERGEMLGLSHIQHIVHRLEDCFKVLKEHPIKVDRKLESLFLGVSDTLKELIENCTEPSGLTEEMLETLMLETEPVFKWLHEHLELLVQQSSTDITENTNILPKTSSVTSAKPLPQKSESWQNLQTLKSQVIRTLREMLQLFKQTATPETRQRLYECCAFLVELGEEFNWFNWSNLCRTAGSAIAHPENTYLTLAKIVITDIKQALELASTGREAEVTISQQLQALVSVESAIELLEIPLDLADELEISASYSTSHFVTQKDIPQTVDNVVYTEVLDIESPEKFTNFSEFFEPFNSNDNEPLTSSRTNTNNSEVKVTELNLLADSFESESSDLSGTQDKQEILDMSAEEKIEIILSNSQTEKTDNNLETVIIEETITDKHKVVSTTEDMTLHVSDDFLENKIGLSSDQITKPQQTTELTQNSSEQFIDASEKIQDQISSLLELVLDEKQLLPTNEINQRQTESIQNLELSKNQETNLDDLFLKTAKAEFITVLYKEKISTLGELFTKAEKNNRITIPGNHSKSADLLTVLPETEDLNDFWEPEVKREKGEFSPVHQQNTASELEEILLANAVEEIFDDVAQSQNSTLDSLSLEDSEVNFSLEEEDFNLLFSSDDEDFFQNLTSNPTIPSSIETTIDAEGTAYYRLISNTKKSLFSQQPETLELTPEFTTSPSRTEAFAEQQQNLINHSLLIEPQDNFNLKVTAESSQVDLDILDEPETFSPTDFDSTDNSLQRDLEFDFNQDFLATKAMSSEEELTQEVDTSFNDEFSELYELLSQEVTSDVNAGLKPETTAQAKLSSAVSNQVTSNTDKRDLPLSPFVSRTPNFEQLIKIPVKNLDDLSHLVGELVVNRNTLEQDQERLRQFLDNLLHQMQQLNDVGMRMQELYERSQQEASVQAQDTDTGFTELEIEQLTPFHTLSQEMIELLVRVREATSDINFVKEDTERVAQQLRQVTQALQEGIMRSQMEPFSEVSTRLERGVRESAIKFGKQAQLVLEGGETLIDKVILEHLKSPLTHLLKNAIAHGIETPDVRQAIGKPPVGVITVRAFHQSHQTIISVTDDGAGIDIEAVKSKAIKIGIMTPEQVQSLSEHDVYDLLFIPGFCTKQQEGELTGCATGLDVVLAKVSQMQGKINIESTVGKGTIFTIRLPLRAIWCASLS
ncbi:ATP-binding protein [Brasilonema sp. UFV-L1]|uniref:chemotaxis protein CheA n=1 Tax=Brasilonema sp. UFV-L1 TaxID=2234130 RepID=UPI00145C5EF2|nr:ATP-binding protein [Brasilonema sp. UFV-L1]NMG09327.1 hypothetical protein [Brasilonema sp. UFV-L1]